MDKAKNLIRGLEVEIQVETAQLDGAIEKADRFVQLLERAYELSRQSSRAIRVETRVSVGEYCLERTIEVGNIDRLTQEERRQLIDGVIGEVQVEEATEPAEVESAEQ